MNICIIGAGTYGSYIVDSLQREYPNADITILEVGGDSIQSEDEIGFFSSLKQSQYKGLTDGRWFGFGGTSNKWGGQLLTFTQNDFSDLSPFMQDIVDINEKHRTAVFEKFDLANKNSEKRITNRLFLKTSIWLSYFNRNMFNYFEINKRQNVTIIPHARVTHLEFDDREVAKILYKENGTEKEATFDYYFLAAGAFESARILLSSDVLPENKVMFSDHLSQQVFKVKEGTMIGKEDFVYRLSGSSIITKRFVGEVDGFSFYAHPVLNTDSPLFQSLKELLYKGNVSFKTLSNIFKNIPELIAYAYKRVINSKIHVVDDEWFINIDIENPTQDSYVQLSEECDDYGMPGLDVFYSIGEKSEKIYSRSTALVEKHLEKTGTKFEKDLESISVQTVEDIYHPYGMFCNYNSVNDFFEKYGNMLIVNTGVLPRSGGINPTAAVFPIVEEYINSYLPN